MFAQGCIDGEPRLPWLLNHERHGATTAEALAFFDSLASVQMADMTGSWRGSGFPTGHRIDGLLEAFGWWGKRFADNDQVDPLLFRTSAGAVRAIDARFVPVGLLATLRARSLAIALVRLVWPALRAAFRTRKPTARLRMMEHRGQVTATMCYDYLPIHDVFRRVDETTVLGLMELRGMQQPFFFVLRRSDGVP